MFTIKHIDEKGDQFVMEAMSYAVTREHGPDGNGPVLIRIMTYDTQHQDGNYSGLWVGIPPQNGLMMQTIYVMNQHGATVDKIGFDTIPVDYWGTPESCNADPEMLAA
jgi:hypothetical protein